MKLTQEFGPDIRAELNKSGRPISVLIFPRGLGVSVTLWSDETPEAKVASNVMITESEGSVHLRRNNYPDDSVEISSGCATPAVVIGIVKVLLQV